MSDVTRANGPDLIGFYSGNRSRVAVKRHELDLVSLSVRIDVDHRANISWFEPFFREWRLQNNAVVFFDHDSNLAAWE